MQNCPRVSKTFVINVTHSWTYVTFKKNSLIKWQRNASLTYLKMYRWSFKIGYLKPQDLQYGAGFEEAIQNTYLNPACLQIIKYADTKLIHNEKMIQ